MSDIRPVYDIANCGPRHRFIANGRLVHNSDSLNLQNLPSGRVAGQSTAMRMAIEAPEDKVVLAADSSQIEVRVLAYEANQVDLLHNFANGVDPYSAMASRIYGVPAETILANHKAGNKEYTIMRQLGKAAVLGCIAEDTEVLTDKGYVWIQDITSEHKLWDGVEFVEHDGVVFSGYKECIAVNNVWMTPDHKVLCRNWESGNEYWAEAKSVTPDLISSQGDGLPEIQWCKEIIKEEYTDDDVKVVPTYDIVNCGPRSRFTVRCEDNMVLIVHNCGYGMGKARFFQSVKEGGLDIPQELADRAVDTYRTANASIVALWETCGDVLNRLIAGQEGYFGGPSGKLFKFGQRKLFKESIPGIMLPDGMWLLYRNLRIEYTEENGRSKKEYIYDRRKGGKPQAIRTYSCAIVENLTQALAFSLLKQQALLISKRYPVAFNVHDEFISVVPESEAEEAKAYMERCMRFTPQWLAGCPINCEAAYAKQYGAC